MPKTSNACAFVIKYLNHMCATEVEGREKPDTVRNLTGPTLFKCMTSAAHNTVGRCSVTHHKFVGLSDVTIQEKKSKKYEIIFQISNIFYWKEKLVLNRKLIFYCKICSFGKSGNFSSKNLHFLGPKFKFEI